jgi:cyclopropane fatty-acyl-phospholipid synthase-like methyltransferase
MPVSNPETKPWIAKQLLALKPRTVLDVGAGKGLYLNLVYDVLGKHNVHVTGVEVWEEYVNFFMLEMRYDKLVKADVRDMQEFNYDLVILGDVLEHMSKDDALALWTKISKQAKYAVIAIPVVHHPQDAVNGNPFEVHVKEDWTTTEVLESFPGIIDHAEFSVCGAFLAKFKGDL